MRFLHIFTGVFWAGTAWFFFGWVEPTTKAIGPAAGPFVHHVVAKRRATRFILYASTINVLAGAILYWRASAGLSLAWIGTGIGLGFTIGALAAVGAWLIGLTTIAPTVEKLDAAGTAMAAAGRPPTGEEMARFHALESRLHTAGQADTALLIVAVTLMAVSRYLGG